MIEFGTFLINPKRVSAVGSPEDNGEFYTLSARLDGVWLTAVGTFEDMCILRVEVGAYMACSD